MTPAEAAARLAKLKYGADLEPKDFQPPDVRIRADAWQERIDRHRTRVARPIHLRSAADLATNPVAIQWLVKPYLERNSMAVLFGELGSLKSFLALHWALSVAAGKVGAMHPVAYLSAEGRGLGKRVRGWARHHLDDGEANLPKLPFYAVEHPINLSAPTAVDELVRALDAVDVTPALIVVDTLSRNSDGRVEGSTEDATSYLNLVDSELRARYAACVLLVHHVGHENKQRARGPYVFLANTDANFRVDRPDPDRLAVVVTAGRLKDAETPAPTEFEGVVTDLDELDDDGRPVTTLAIRPTGNAPTPQDRPRAVGRKQAAALAALTEWCRVHSQQAVIASDELRGVLEAQDVRSKYQRRDAVKYLVDVGVLTPSVGGHSVNRGLL